MISPRLLLAGALISAGAAQSAVILDNTYVFRSGSTLVPGTVDVEVIVEDNYLGNSALRNWRYEVTNVDYVPSRSIPGGFALPWAEPRIPGGCQVIQLCGYDIHRTPGWFLSQPWVQHVYPGSWLPSNPFTTSLRPGNTIEFGFATTSQGIVHVSGASEFYGLDLIAEGSATDPVFGDIDIPSTPPTPFPATAIPEPSPFAMLCGALILFWVLIGSRKHCNTFVRGRTLAKPSQRPCCHS